MNYLTILVLSCFLFVQAASAQQFLLTGHVKDENGDAIPSATVYLQGTNIGTAANSEGEFLLRVPTGEYILLARAVGYKQKTQTIKADEDHYVSIVLDTASFRLEEVVIGRTEDPAYRIIRHAMQQRRIYLEQAAPYTADVYIKGVQRLLQAPSSFLGIDLDEIGREIGLDSNRTGLVYLSESESRITVDPPRGFHEEMRSSRISGNNRAFSFNRASDLQLNFYENSQIIFEGLSERPFVSPIASQAMSYYRYRYVGNMDEGGLLVHKISVIPRRKGEPVYAGDLYILDGSWRIYGVDLILTKDASLNLLDTLAIKQDFVPISASQWQPSQIHFDFVGGLLGFRIGGYFAAVFSDYTLEPQPARRPSGEVLRIDAGVNEKDSSYWNANRPLALTDEEARDYVRKDSIRHRRESKSYLDSLDRVSNRFKPVSFLLTGHQYRNRSKRTTLALDGLASSLLYNTVEGMAIHYGLRYTQQTDTVLGRNFTLEGNIRYGFANKRLNGYAGVHIPIGQSTLTIRAGSHMADLNSRGSLPVLFNTVSSLIFGRNHQKLYERTFGQLAWQSTLPANIQLQAALSWENRLWLPNATDYTLFSRHQHHITSNNPFTPDADIPLFGEHQAWRLSVMLAYDFGTKYETYPHRRVYLPSKHPTLRLYYSRGMPGLLGSDVEFDQIRAELTKENMRLGLYGHLSFLVSGGTFLNEGILFYPDLRHFNGTKTPITDQQLSSFLLLDYYVHSSSGRFGEAHAEYNLATLLTSKVPLLRRLRLQEIIGGHYLHTPDIGHYGEWHAGLQWTNIRVMYARSFGSKPGFTPKQAVRIGLRLPIN